MRYSDFYSELGKLMYSIAKADGRVGEKEYETLKNIVREELVPLESSTDQFGSDNAFYTEISFEYLESNFGDPGSAFNSFCDYLEKNKSSIDASLLEVIRRISKKIADSEFGIEQKEQKWLDKLEQKIDSLS